MKPYLSVKEVCKLLGVSRVQASRQVKTKPIKCQCGTTLTETPRSKGGKGFLAELRCRKCGVSSFINRDAITTKRKRAAK